MSFLGSPSTGTSPTASKTMNAGIHFKTPMSYVPSAAAKPSPSRQEMWKKELGFEDDDEEEDDPSSNPEDEPEADQVSGNVSSIEFQTLQLELQQKEKQREDLLLKLKTLTDKTSAYRSKLQKSEHNKKAQVKILKKAHDVQMQEKMALLRELEDLVEEQENKINEMDHVLQTGGTTPMVKKPSGIHKLVDSINVLHDEKARLHETLLSSQSELEVVKEEHKENVKKLTDDLSEMEKQVKKLEAEKEKLLSGDQRICHHDAAKIKTNEDENSELKKRVKSLELELSSRAMNEREKTQKMEEELRDVRKKLRNTEAKYSNLAATPPKVQVKTVTVVAEETKKQLEDMIHQNKELEELLAKTKADAKKKISQLEEGLHKLHNSVQDSKTKEEQAKAESQALKENLKSKSHLEKSLREKDSQLEELQKEVAKCHSEVMDLKRESAHQSKAMAAEREEAVQEAIRKTESKYSSMKKRMDAQLMQLRNMSLTVKQLHREHKSLKIDCLKFCTTVGPTTRDVQTKIMKRVDGLDSQNKILVQKYRREMTLRKKFHNELVELKGNIRVLCRVRPIIREDGEGSFCNEVIRYDDNDDSIINIMHKGYKSFEMDKVFTPASTQEQVFNEVKALVTSCIDGYNVCIFAYGQTGSGKTYTMEGPAENPGINQRALKLLFEEIKAKSGDWTHQIQVSVMEIYNEMIRDLLSPDASDNLQVKQSKEGLYVPGLNLIQVKSLDEVNEVFALGKENRATATTNMNEHSSRSHALLCVTVTGTNNTTGTKVTGKLNLIDLAGSERVGKSGAEGDRMKEAQNINKSLSALGDVIHSLKNNSAHVPYRNSKLTYLLQDSLGGDSKTLMVVQVAPVEKNAGETVCSLTFAQRVRTVELGQASRRVETMDSSSRLRDSEMYGSPSRLRTPTRSRR